MNFDITFCAHYYKCTKGKDCYRAYTNDVRVAAAKAKKLLSVKSRFECFEENKVE